MLKNDILLLDRIVNKKNRRILMDEEFFWLYPFTNENIKAYYKKIDFKNKDVLTVTSSGDHILNAILMGANSVESIDSNPLAKYYVELKIAGIKSLSYEEFLLFFYNKKILTKSKYFFSRDIYKNKIRKELNGDFKVFWDYIIESYSTNQLYNSMLFTDDFLDLINLVKVNDYLKQSRYYELKNKLFNKTVKYYDMDINNLNSLEKKYDVIILSNVPAFLDISNIEYELKKLKNNIQLISRENSSVVVCYLYGGSTFSYANEGIYNRDLVGKIFDENNYEYINFKSSDTLSYQGIMKKIFDSNDSVLVSKNKTLKKTYDK